MSNINDDRIFNIGVGVFLLGMLIVIVIMIGGIVSFTLGQYGEASKDGECAGYSLHNESVYNSSILYIRSNGLGLGYIDGPDDVYFKARGYVIGYEKWDRETKASEFDRLFENNS